MTFDSIISELKSGNYHPVYFLSGEETYFIDAIADYIIRHALKEEEKAFNQLIVYGRDTELQTILESARKFPMMASRQLIVVREAQHLKNLEFLESYLQNIQKSTILVFVYKYKKLDKRTRLSKLLQNTGILFESEKIWEDKVPAWIAGYVQEKNCRIDQKSASLLVEFLGNDLEKIANELDKLMLLLPSVSGQITPDLIERNIGISKDFNNFELTRALAMGDGVKANQIVQYFAKNPKNNPLLVTLSALFYYFVKVLRFHGLADKSKESVFRELGIRAFHYPEYQHAARRFSLQHTMRIIGWLRVYDLKSKGGSLASDGELLRELVYKILHVA